MLIIPAIDLRGGSAVRLVQGLASAETVYSSDPVEVARGFAASGARRIHVVDLDGAFVGHSVQIDLIRKIAAVGIPVEIGGGIRDLLMIEALVEAGVGWVILGTAAIRDPRLVGDAVARFGARVIVGIDARDGRVRVDGWTGDSSVTPDEVARQMKSLGVTRLIYTNIATDGMLTGPDLEGLKRLSAIGLPLTASGGIGSLDDVRALLKLEASGVDSCIIGKAIYDGKIDLKQALEAVG